MHFLKVAESQDADPIEIPAEDDGTLLVDSLTAQYPGSTGLKYNFEGHTRAVKIADNKLHPPESGWGDLTYYCIYPKESVKRKADNDFEESDAKNARKDDADSKWADTDLVVLGLPWKTTDKELQEYFSKFGALQMAQVKLDPITQKSKGYGFIRFVDQEIQVRVMLQRHQIDGRWCDVRIPVSRDGIVKKSPCKVFVGQCTEDLTEDVLREYFSKFGEISDLYVPKPFRAFAFVTFVESSAARSACSTDHTVKNTKVFVTEAVPKGEKEKFGRELYSSGGRTTSAYGGSSRNRKDYYSGYGDFERRRPWSRDDWGSDVGYKSSDSWRTKSTWSSARSAGNSATSASRWKEPAAGDAGFDPDVVAAVVNKAVLGVFGTLKTPPAGELSPPKNGSGSSFKDDVGWWSRR